MRVGAHRRTVGDTRVGVGEVVACAEVNDGTAGGVARGTRGVAVGDG